MFEDFALENISELGTSNIAEWNELQMNHLENMQNFNHLGITEWNNLESVVAKRDILQALSDRCSEIQGMHPVPIELGDPGKGNAGGYSLQSERITLRPEDLANCNTIKELSDLRDTVLHETYHAYQHQCVQGMVQHSNPLEVEIWRENFKPENYISPQENFIGYFNQPVEVSAREFAAIHNEQIAKCFGNETPLNVLFDSIKTNSAEFITENRHLWRPVMLTAAKSIKNII